MCRCQTLTPLSPAERSVAERHYRLVEWYVRHRGLPVDEYLDVAVFGYLLAVKRWFARPDLYRYEFTTIAARQELIDGGYLDFTPGIKGRPSTYHLRSVEEMEGWQPPPDDLEGDFLAEFKEDPTSYFGYTEALGVELAETTAHLWAEFFPGKTPGPYDEKRTFFQIMVQSQNEDGEWSMSFPEENKELLGYAFEQGRKRGKLFWGYIESVMRNLRDCGIKTVEEACENEEKFYERRGWNK